MHIVQYVVSCCLTVLMEGTLCCAWLVEPSVTDSYDLYPSVSLCVCSADCPSEVCSGLYVEEAFQCNGTVNKISLLCKLSDQQTLQVYLLHKGSSLLHPKRINVNSDVSTTYWAGDFIVYHITRAVTEE